MYVCVYVCNPKIESLNTKMGSLNPKIESLNLESESLNPIRLNH